MVIIGLLLPIGDVGSIPVDLLRWKVDCDKNTLVLELPVHDEAVPVECCEDITPGGGYQ